MSAIITDVTTTIQIKSEHSGFIFDGSVTIYNNLKIVKEINCKVTKKTIPESTMPMAENRYVVTRGFFTSSPSGYLQLGEDREAMLAAGVEFEAMITTLIPTMIQTDGESTKEI